MERLTISAMKEDRNRITQILNYRFIKDATKDLFQIYKNEIVYLQTIVLNDVLQKELAWDRRSNDRLFLSVEDPKDRNRC